jgi:RNA polymerase sigma factor (sigma-70 family)
VTTRYDPGRIPLPALAAPGPVTVRARSAQARDVETVILAAYEAHARDLNAFARSLVREREAAEDLVAEAYLRLVREAHAGRTPDDVRAWLYRVVGNLVMSRGRRLTVARRFLVHLVDRRTGESPEARHLRLDVEPALRDAVLALPPDMRIALVMAARGSAGAEIAATIGRSEAATRTLLTRARQRVRVRLEQRGAPGESARRQDPDDATRDAGRENPR